jgi:hypothetical protein
VFKKWCAGYVNVQVKGNYLKVYNKIKYFLERKDDYVVMC